MFRRMKRDPANRSKVTIATKGGLVATERVVNGDPEYMHIACDKSLERMGIDQIDLYYLQASDFVVDSGWRD